MIWALFYVLVAVAFAVWGAYGGAFRNREYLANDVLVCAVWPFSLARAIAEMAWEAAARRWPQ